VSTIERKCCIVKVNPYTGEFVSVEAIRSTQEEASHYIQEHRYDDDVDWLVVWAVVDI
jgi:hypothetical protein